MKFKKAYLTFPVIIILLALLFCLPGIIESIPSGNMRFGVIITLYVLVLILFIYEALHEIIKKQFTTTIFVVLMDIVEITSFGFAGYLSYKINLTAALLDKVQFHLDSTLLIIVFMAAGLIKQFLKTQRFRK
ncbi:MAG: hypothetical protein Q8930_02315 [Bacillota bacterium]|nr:hypothetical protein [Bacillota bacterium]